MVTDRTGTAFVALLSFMVFLFGGCANTPSGVRVVASSATATTVGDINWDEYKIPVFSVYTGPKTTIWVNRDYLALKRIAASGSVTNDTAAFGIYTSQEQKQTRVELEFKTPAVDFANPVLTNVCTDMMPCVIEETR